VPRYIDADLLFADIQNYLCVNCSAEYLKDNFRCSACEIADCLRMIDNAPTADVQEVKHGQCIGADNEKVNFCPNCGTKIDGVMSDA